MIIKYINNLKIILNFIIKLHSRLTNTIYSQLRVVRCLESAACVQLLVVGCIWSAAFGQLLMVSLKWFATLMCYNLFIPLIIRHNYYLRNPFLMMQNYYSIYQFFCRNRISIELSSSYQKLAGNFNQNQGSKIFEWN